MNKVTYIEVFTTMNAEGCTTYVRFRRQKASYKTHHEVHKIDSVHQADRLNKVLRKTCTIGGGTVGPWGIMSFVYYPIPTGTPVDAHPVEEPEYRILATKYIPAPDSQQIVYVAVAGVAGVADDWAGYVGVFPTNVDSKHAAQRAAELGVKLFEAEAKGMFPEHTSWNRDYRR